MAQPSRRMQAKLKASGLAAGADGLVEIETLHEVSGTGFYFGRNARPRCSPALALMLVGRKYARPAPAEA